MIYFKITGQEKNVSKIFIRLCYILPASKKNKSEGDEKLISYSLTFIFCYERHISILSLFFFKVVTIIVFKFKTPTRVREML